jgi:hypothetical protein
VRGKEVGAEKRLVSNKFYFLLVLYLVATTTALNLPKRASAGAVR